MTDVPSSRAVYLDTNVFVKAVEGIPEAASPAKALIDALRNRPGTGVTSEITFAEVLAPPASADALPLHIKRRVYLDLLLWSGFIRLVPVTRSVLMETADLREVARLQLPDAIHVVSAIRANCRFVVSADRDLRRLPTQMVWVNPDDHGISDLLRELA